MRRPDLDLPCEEALGVLEPYLDGDLPGGEARRLREHLERCPSCAAERDLAVRIQRELRALPQLDCPPELPGRARSAGCGEVVPFRPRPRAVGLRLAAAAAVLALAAGGGALFVQLQPREDRPSPRQIAQATEEARLALAYFGKVTRRAGRDLRDDVLEKRLVEPALEGVSRSLVEIPGSTSGAPPDGRSEKEF